jgi:hypothetical protein
MNESQRRWLRGALATPKGGTHEYLGKYTEQTEGRAGYIVDVCHRCGLSPTRKGHDPCLADLPGVINACCGHGVTFAYATLSNGFCLMGRSLKVYLQKMGRLKHFQRLAGGRGWYKRQPRP